MFVPPLAFTVRPTLVDVVPVWVLLMVAAVVVLPSDVLSPDAPDEETFNSCPPVIFVEVELIFNAVPVVNPSALMVAIVPSVAELAFTSNKPVPE